jgi:hypothetical protein
MLRTYKLSTQDFEMAVEIDTDRMTEERLHEINRFWGDAEYRVASSNGDVTTAVLRLLFDEVRGLVQRSPRALSGVLYAFAWEDSKGKYKDGVEGWPAMNGSEGIRIVSCWLELELDEDIFVEEVTEAERRAA